MDSFLYSINATVPIFLVMIVGWVIKQLGVIDDHFANVAITVGLIFLIAFFPSNDAPIHISATGVAVCAILLIVLLIITGYLNPAREDNNPSTIPIIIGLVTILKHAFLMFSFLSVDCSSVLP